MNLLAKIQLEFYLRQSPPQNVIVKQYFPNLETVQTSNKLYTHSYTPGMITSDA